MKAWTPIDRTPIGRKPAVSLSPAYLESERPNVSAMRATLLICLLFLLVPAVATADPVVVLRNAQFVRSDSNAPPADSAPWKFQPLPDNWDVEHPHSFGYAWYRLRFDLPFQPEQPYAAYLSAFRNDGRIWVNGVYTGRTVPCAMPWSGPPQIFTIPPTLLHAGPNTIDLRLFVQQGDGGTASGQGGVSPVIIGDERSVRPQYELELYFRETGPEFSGILSAVLGLFMLSLWVQRRQETMYGYFGLVALLWAASTLYDFVSNPPIPIPEWLTVMYSLDHVLPVLLFVFALRYAGWRWPRIERWLWIYAVVSIPMIYVEQHYSDGAIVWRFTYYPIIFGYLAILAIAAQRRPAVERVLLTLAVLLQAFAHIYQLVSAEFLSELGVYLLWSYSTLPLYVAIGWSLVDRFARSLGAFEDLNAGLELRIEQKRSELEGNYQLIQRMEQERAIAGERKRIMSDMHDGVGGQLISTLSMVEQGDVTVADVATALRECIDDLRLTIDSLEPTENDLLPVLGNFRYRIEQRLKGRGIELDWQVNELPRFSNLTAQSVLHVLRILQEAFANVLKHAQASAVKVTTGVDASGGNAYIRLHDNGIGFVGDRAGYGLRNMRQRARMLGGDLDIQSSSVGTTLNLLLPVH
jgi:signal transduction histidine kinase